MSKFICLSTRKVQIALVKSKPKHCIDLERNTGNDVGPGVTVKLFSVGSVSSAEPENVFVIF